MNFKEFFNKYRIAVYAAGGILLTAGLASATLFFSNGGLLKGKVYWDLSQAQCTISPLKPLTTQTVTISVPDSNIEYWYSKSKNPLIDSQLTLAGTKNPLTIVFPLNTKYEEIKVHYYGNGWGGYSVTCPITLADPPVSPSPPPAAASPQGSCTYLPAQPVVGQPVFFNASTLFPGTSNITWSTTSKTKDVLDQISAQQGKSSISVVYPPGTAKDTVTANVPIGPGASGSYQQPCSITLAASKAAQAPAGSASNNNSGKAPQNPGQAALNQPTVTCKATPSTVATGETITWTATPLNLPAGAKPTYQWLGISGNTSPISKSFNTSGTKTATVQMDLGPGFSPIVSPSCSVVVNNPPKSNLNPVSASDNQSNNPSIQDLLQPNISCKATPSSVNLGETVTWSATPINIPAGTTPTYQWAGDLTGSSFPVTKSYDGSGKKVATIVMNIGPGYAPIVSPACSVVVNNPVPAANACAVQISDTPAQVQEGGSVQVPITLSGNCTNPVGVHLGVTSSNASVTTDYSEINQDLMIDPGTASKSVVLSAPDNSIVNDSRSVQITLSSPTNAVLGNPSSANISIADNDQQTAGLKTAVDTINCALQTSDTFALATRQPLVLACQVLQPNSLVSAIVVQGNFDPVLGLESGTPVKTFMLDQTQNTSFTVSWDGTNSQNQLVPVGDYSLVAWGRPDISYNADFAINPIHVVQQLTVANQPAAPSKCSNVNYPSDISGHWAETHIRTGYDRCFFAGYPDGTFHPDEYVTRAEAAKMDMVGAGKKPHPNCYTADCGANYQQKVWKDILAAWQGPWIRAGRDAGILEGYPDFTFRPNNLVTRAEAAALISKTDTYAAPAYENCYSAGCGAGYPNNIFVDIRDFWQGKYIRALWDKRWIQGRAPKFFAPNDPITRAEMAKLVIEASTALTK